MSSIPRTLLAIPELRRAGAPACESQLSLKDSLMTKYHLLCFSGSVGHSAYIEALRNIYCMC